MLDFRCFSPSPCRYALLIDYFAADMLPPAMPLMLDVSGVFDAFTDVTPPLFP